MEGPRGAGLPEMTQAEIPGLWLWALPLCSPLLSAVCPYLCSPRMELSFAHSQNATRATVECNSCKPNPHMLVAPSSELRGDDGLPLPTLNGFKQPCTCCEGWWPKSPFVYKQMAQCWTEEEKWECVLGWHCTVLCPVTQSCRILQPHGL